MDEQRFDQLSRRLAGFRTRRQAVKAIAGAVVATVAGTRAVGAQACTAHYSPCTGDNQCCPGAICEYGLCMPGCRIDGAFTNAWMSPPENICAQCRPELSTTAWTPANEGMSCWSGDPSAGATFCQDGACAPSGPAQCPPPPPCHTDQLIDAATCTYAVAEAGTPCGGQAMCHGGFYQPADTCDGNGFCIGGGTQVVSCGSPERCDPALGCFECLTDGDCHLDDICNSVACVDNQCVTSSVGGSCGAYQLGCGDGDCPDALNGLTACFQTSEQESVCAGNWACANPACTTSSECDEGYVCVIDSCCFNAQCVRACGSRGAQAAGAGDLVERRTSRTGMTGLGI